MCLTNSWSILLCDLCTSVLNLKPLPLPDGLNQNTHECRASNDAKKKKKIHPRRCADAKNPTKIGQETSRFQTFYFIFVKLDLVFFFKLYSFF